MSNEPKRRSWGWIGWVALTVFVLYPLSIGPAYWLCEKNNKAGRVVFETVYAPIFFAAYQSEAAMNALTRYLATWTPSVTDFPSETP
jgi:hypothetical protein